MLHYKNWIIDDNKYFTSLAEIYIVYKKKSAIACIGPANVIVGRSVMLVFYN